MSHRMEVQGVAPSEILHARRAAARASGVSKKVCALEPQWAIREYKGDPLHLAAGPFKSHTWER
eukprot:7809016-Pyramimonas_sp.AAC.1